MELKFLTSLRNIDTIVKTVRIKFSIAASIFYQYVSILYVEVNESKVPMTREGIHKKLIYRLSYMVEVTLTTGLVISFSMLATSRGISNCDYLLVKRSFTPLTSTSKTVTEWKSAVTGRATN